MGLCLKREEEGGEEEVGVVISIKSLQHDFLNIDIPKWTGKTLGPQPYTQNYRQGRNATAGETIFPRKSIPIDIQYQMVSHYIHTSNTVQTEKRYLEMYMYKNIHVCMQNQLMRKWGHKFERQQTPCIWEGMEGGKGREEKNGTIIISKHKRNNRKCPKPGNNNNKNVFG